MSERQLRFVNEMLTAKTATEAARRAGYAHPGIAAAKLMRNPNVTRAIAKSTAPIAKQVGIHAAEVLQQLLYLLTRRDDDFRRPDGMLLTPAELSDRAQACIDGYDQDVLIQKDDDGEEVSRILKTKIRLSPKATAVDMALRHKGLFPKDIQNHLHQHLHVDYDQLSGAAPDVPDRVQEKLEGTVNAPSPG